MATLNFNAADIEPAAPISALPPGRYPVAISKTEMKDTKAGTGQYLQIELTITSGTAANRKLWARLSLVNQNQQAVDIAYRELSAICHAVGVLQVNDSDELLGREMMVDVGIEKNGQTGEDTNRVKGYAAIGGTPAKPALPAAKPAAGKAAPWAKAAA